MCIRSSELCQLSWPWLDSLHTNCYGTPMLVIISPGTLLRNCDESNPRSQTATHAFHPLSFTINSKQIEHYNKRLAKLTSSFLGKH